MTLKEQAIKQINSIRNSGLDVNGDKQEIPEGLIDIDLWNDPVFRCGMGYGFILMLMKFFDIKKEEL